MIDTASIQNKLPGVGAISISPFNSRIRMTEPFRNNNYFEIIYLSAGGGICAIDDKAFVVKPPILFMIRRGQIQFWDLTEQGEGFDLIIGKEFVEEVTDRELKTFFRTISGCNCLELEEYRTVERLLEILIDEQKKEARSNDVTQWVLKVFFAKTLEAARTAKREGSGKADLYNRYMLLLEGQAAVKRRVQYYADMLYTSPQNLNNACRRRAGRSAAEVLGDFIVSEAKQLLVYTDRKVTDIASSLDFKDPSHFVKYFKRVAGQTPQAYREGAVAVDFLVN